VTTTLELRFPFGRYHGTPWGRQVNEGAVDWPPAPWRLLRALVAVWKQRAPELPADEVVKMLDALTDPPRFALPEAEEAHTRHYMPAMDHLRGVKASTDKVIDAFVAFGRGSAVYVDWDVTLPDELRHALEVLAQRLAYLGRAESACVGRLLPVGSAMPEVSWLEPKLEDPGRSTQAAGVYKRVLAASSPLDMESLIQRTVDARKYGSALPKGTRWVWYASAFSKSAGPRRTGSLRVLGEPAAQRPVALRWSYWAPAAPPLTLAVALADALHRAAVARFTARPRASEGRSLLGRDSEGFVLEGHRHAHWLAFPRHRSGRHVDFVAVYASDGFDAEETVALCGLTELRSMVGTHPLRARLALEAVGSAASAIPELAGPSRIWESVTPYAPPRHPRPRQKFAEHVERHVRKDLASLGLPEPVGVLDLDPWGSWLDFRRYRLDERIGDARPARGVRLEFAEPVDGPIVLGALRHFGLGLFRPLGEG